MPSTILLDTQSWDLFGNIAVATEPYSLAQDAASAIRLFAGEAWYNRDIGVPYFAQILGHAPPVSLMRAKFEAAALTVPGVVFARCYISSIKERDVSGQVQVPDAAGVVSAARF